MSPATVTSKESALSRVAASLAGLADDIDSDSLEQRARLLRHVLILHVTARAWIAAMQFSDNVEYMVLAVAIGLGAIASLFDDAQRLATRFLALVVAGWFLFTVPFGANHLLLETLALGLFATYDLDDAEERAALMRAYLWLIAVVVFWTGLNKLLFGTYFRGQYLAYQLAHYERFRLGLGLIVPSEEMARLISIDQRGAFGPYLLEAPHLLVLSNLVYVFEMLLPVALLVRRTRRVAVVGLLALMVAIEASAREVFFGALVAVPAAAFFGHPRALKAVAVAVGSVYAYLVLAAVGVVEGFGIN